MEPSAEGWFESGQRFDRKRTKGAGPKLEKGVKCTLYENRVLYSEPKFLLSAAWLPLTLLELVSKMVKRGNNGKKLESGEKELDGKTFFTEEQKTLGVTKLCCIKVLSPSARQCTAATSLPP